MYTPLSSLVVPVIVKFTLVLVILLFPIWLIAVLVLLTNALSLKTPLSLLHVIVGEGMPIDSQVNVMSIPSLITVALSNGVMLGGTAKVIYVTSLFHLHQHKLWVGLHKATILSQEMESIL